MLAPSPGGLALPLRGILDPPLQRMHSVLIFLYLHKCDEHLDCQEVTAEFIKMKHFQGDFQTSDQS